MTDKHDAPLSRLDIEQMAERGAMAAEVTLPGEKFRALVAVALSDMGRSYEDGLEEAAAYVEQSCLPPMPFQDTLVILAEGIRIRKNADPQRVGSTEALRGSITPSALPAESAPVGTTPKTAKRKRWKKRPPARLVPVEPTWAMLEALAGHPLILTASDEQEIRRRYNAMLNSVTFY